MKIMDDLSTKYLGEEAMAVAKLAAQDEHIIQAFKNDNASAIIQPIAEKIRKQSGASYIVIGNTKGIRYSHPDPRFIGKSMGTSNIPVFKDHISVVYFGEGISGPAIKAKTPIGNDKGEIIGVSSVVFLLVDIKKGILTYRNEIIGFALFLLLIGITAAYFISRRIKRKIFNLEPEEISLVFKEKDAILESIHDGIIAIDKNYQVISMNKRARKMLENAPITNGVILPDGRLKNLIGEVIQSKKGRSTQKVIIGNQVYIIALSLITQENLVLVTSVVISLQTEDEIEQIVNEVSEITSYTENMRALNHEFLNKLNTIYGLLSISEYEKAKELISDEVKDRQDIISFQMSSVKNPLLVACLLGKINRSKELKVDLEVDQDSSLSDIPETIDTKLLVSL
ncbi:Spo0B domain-containing protein [Rummeliibacillus sp. JY-2-4R]